MKRVLVLATLLMVGCGGNQNENKGAEDGGAKKVSAQMADGKRLPEMQMAMYIRNKMLYFRRSVK